jgi:hypothetical protein
MSRVEYTTHSPELYQDNYEILMPSPQEMQNLVHPKELLPKVTRLGKITYEYEGQLFKFLRDFQGNTFAQCDDEIMPLHRFLEMYKKKYM